MRLGARQPNPRFRSLAAASGLFLLVQALGVNLLCFCGSCDMSQALGLATASEPEHPCCREAKARERREAQQHTTVSGQHRCCDTAHSLTHVEANVRDQASAGVHAAPVLVTLTSGVPMLLPHLRTVAANVRSRAPPLRAGPALYLQHASLLI